MARARWIVRDPYGGVPGGFVVFEGPIEDDALRSEWLWGIDPERCEVVG